MDRQIPIYFDTVVVDSPIQEISASNPNIGRLKVRVFTKYENRNGSYITDQVAEQLISSATRGNTPVVGFFDPHTSSWASHTGPNFANGYGYVEDFLGWEPFTDKDGITRDYAVFSVILFSEYFNEAKQIIGQNQSMELDAHSITGEWTKINNEDYFVYSTASIMGLCVIGSHEPCFSVSAFFSKDDSEYKSQYEKFSSLLADLRDKVEEAIKGGEQPMNELENNQEVVEPETVEAAPEVVESAAEPVEEAEAPEEPAAEEETISEFEIMQQQFNELQESYNALKTDYEAAQNRIAELEAAQNNREAEFAALQTQNQELQNVITEYQDKDLAERKESLFEKYEKIISEEEINQIREQANNYSYEELESKLAITFANRQMMADSNSSKVPLPEPEESQFALLMKKYRKN